jgi:mono/diheme cytochrome c family protein
VGALLAVAGLLPAGCQQKYPDTLTYPLRGDVLVIHPPKKDPDHLDTPGQLTDWFAKLPVDNPKGDLLNPANIPGNDRAALETALNKAFGTPAHPKVEGLEPDAVEKLGLKPEALAEGADLYRQHCMHCHGLTGNGQGPTAPWINPHPRDYRRGKFKFTSSAQSEGTRKPRREDLIRTITQGIEGTAMPAFGAQSNSKFGVLPEDQIEKLAGYVTHLSLRGQAEYQTMETLLTPPGNLEVDNNPATADEFVADRVKDLAGYWVQANDQTIKPGKYPYATEDRKALEASIARGFNLFVQPGAASCIKCHLDFGRRNNYKYDDWGTIVRPLDLTQGVFRGGRRPLDIYWRMYSGVNGASMPAFGDSLKPEQIWDVVNFVEALPYPAMLPADVRRQVYEGAPDVAEGQHAGLDRARPTTRPEAQE